MFRSLTCALLLGAAACQPTDKTGSEATTNATRLVYSDFEQALGWGSAETGSLTRDKAHSGKWSVKVTPQIPFSYTYSLPLEQALQGRPLPRKVRLRAQVLCASPGSTAQLVIQINRAKGDTAKVFYGALPLLEAVREYDAWVPVSRSFELPATLAPANQLTVYLWNNQGIAPSYADDLELVVEE